MGRKSKKRGGAEKPLAYQYLSHKSILTPCMFAALSDA